MELIRLDVLNISIGLGSHSLTYVDFMLNNLRGDNYNYGLLINHFKNDFKIDEKLSGMSKNSIMVFGKMILDKHILIGDLNHERNRFYSYGHEHPFSSSYGLIYDEELLRNHFDYTRISFSMASNQVISGQIKYNTNY